MIEVWKDVKGYIGLYQVSNLGNVKSIDSLVNTKGNSKRLNRGRKLKPFTSNDGYYRICLSKNNNKKNHSLHRLVLQAFVPNPLNKRTGNHKDCNKLNNFVENLEWATYKENVNHAWNNGLCEENREKMRIFQKRKVNQIDIKTNKIIKIWDSAKEAGEELNLFPSNITAVCRKLGRTVGGYKWEYYNGKRKRVDFMNDKRPQCDCGEELLLNRYITKNKYYTITRDGNRHSKKQNRIDLPNYVNEIKEFICPYCKNTYEVEKEEPSKPKYRRGILKDGLPF
jgi:hypothetical protein